MADAIAFWLPIELADKSISQVQDFSEVGIILRNSDRYWVRDDDGRVYEASWADDKAGYWWDWEGESLANPVEFMPHPLDPRWADQPACTAGDMVTIIDREDRDGNRVKVTVDPRIAALLLSGDDHER